MAVDSYVLVSTDPADLVIKGGPMRWDGTTLYTPPAGQTTMLTATAISGGYTFPPLPVGVVNAAALQAKAANALAGNAAFVALASPSNAQTLAQVKALTRQMDALIRLTLNQLDDISDT